MHCSAISWHEAEGNPLADRNPYVGPQAVGEGVFARLLAAIDNFTAVPDTFIDGGAHVVYYGEFYPDMATVFGKMATYDVNARWGAAFEGIITTITDTDGTLITASRFSRSTAVTIEAAK